MENIEWRQKYRTFYFDIFALHISLCIDIIKERKRKRKKEREGERERERKREREREGERERERERDHLIILIDSIKILQKQPKITLV